MLRRAVPPSTTLRASSTMLRRQGVSTMVDTSWLESQASSKEHWSFLPILNVMKGGAAVHDIAPTASVFRAVVDMVKYRQGSLLVTEQGEMRGILTERDVLDKLPFGVGASRVATVASIMTPSTGLVTAPPSFTVDKCAKAMRTGVFRHLPITDKGHVKAIISIRGAQQGGCTCCS